MGEERVAAVQDMGHCVQLVGAERDIRVHAAERDMGTVVFPRPLGIEYLIIAGHQHLPALRVLPYPVLKGILYGLLPLLGERRFFLVEDPVLFAVRILNCVIYAQILEVQGLFQDAVGICPLRPIGHIGRNVIPARLALPADPPFRGIFGKADPDTTAQVEGRLEGLVHELLEDPGRNPGRTEAHVDLRCVKVLRLRLLERPDIDGVLRACLLRHTGNAQLLPDIPGQIFVRRLPSFLLSPAIERVPEDDAGELIRYLSILSGLSQKVCHIRQIDRAFLPDRYRQGLDRRVHMVHLPLRADGPLHEHVRLAHEPPVLVKVLKGAQKVVGGILFECLRVRPRIDPPELFCKCVIGHIQLPLLRLDVRLRVVLHLVVDQLVHDPTEDQHPLDPGSRIGLTLDRAHDGILTEMDFPVIQGIGKVFHGRVCRDRIA